MQNQCVGFPHKGARCEGPLWFDVDGTPFGIGTILENTTSEKDRWLVVGAAPKEWDCFEWPITCDMGAPARNPICHRVVPQPARWSVHQHGTQLWRREWYETCDWCVNPFADDPKDDGLCGRRADEQTFRRKKDGFVSVSFRCDEHRNLTNDQWEVIQGLNA